MDGCKGGWLGVLFDESSHDISVQIFSQFADILSDLTVTIIAIDIPIGIPQARPWPRPCDVGARTLLGYPRLFSVFDVPLRCAWEAEEYRDALQRQQAEVNKGFSKQAWGILPKIKEVDTSLIPANQNRVYEVHPEVSFWRMAGRRPMVHSKRKKDGRQEREHALAKEFGQETVNLVESQILNGKASLDDRYDALAALWTGLRIAHGHSNTVQQETSRDSRGLEMQIHY